MKRVLLSGVALAALVGSASAADLPRRPAPVAAPVPYVSPVYNWTVKGEYLYVDLGDINCSVANCGGTGPTKVDFTSHLVRAGLNYRF